MTEPDVGCETEKDLRRIWRYCLVLFFVAYFFTCKGYLEVSDTSFSVQTAEAIVTRGTLDIPPSESYTLKGPDGRSYSKYGIGLALYYLPWVAVSHALSWFIGIPAFELTGFLISFANLPFALLTLHLFVRCLCLLGVTSVTTVFMLMALGLGTLFWRYACYDFSEMMQTGLLMLSLYCVLRRTGGCVVLGGLGFAGLILVKLVYLALLPAFLGYLLAHPGQHWQRRVRDVAGFLWPVVTALGIVAYLNAIRFGSPIESGYGDEAGKFFPTQLWWTIPRLLVSLDKGLIVFCPVLLLGLVGWPSFWRKYPREATLCGALVVGNLVLAGAWHSWIGGWSWGPRLLVPAIPLWLLPAAFWLDDRRRHQRLAAAVVLAVLSVVTQIPGVLVKDQEIHHIKYNMLTPQEQPASLSDYEMAWCLLYHKLTDPTREEVYRLSQLGVPGNRELDLTEYRTFRGLNLWTEHTARHLNLSLIRWLPVIGAAIIFYFIMKLWRSLSVVRRMG